MVCMRFRNVVASGVQIKLLCDLSVPFPVASVFHIIILIIFTTIMLISSYVCF